jgi:hypothetical protein
VLWHIVAGKRFEYSDPKLQDLVKVVDKATRINFSFFSLTSSVPFLKKLFPSLGTAKQQAHNFAAIFTFLQATIDQHRKNFDPDNIGDFIDAYLAEIKVIVNHPFILIL